MHDAVVIGLVLVAVLLVDVVIVVGLPWLVDRLSR